VHEWRDVLCRKFIRSARRVDCGGAEWRLDQHWSAKIEYQFVDLGGETVRITALIAIPPAQPSSFNAGFRDQFHVVRVGLNYWY
jgi:opacity protein-like surface antigen